MAKYSLQFFELPVSDMQTDNSSLMINSVNDGGYAKKDAIILICLVSRSVKKPTQTEHVMPEINSKRKCEKLAVVAYLHHIAQTLVISRFCFAKHGYEMYKDL